MHSRAPSSGFGLWKHLKDQLEQGGREGRAGEGKGGGQGKGKEEGRPASLSHTTLSSRTRQEQSPEKSLWTET